MLLRLWKGFVVAFSVYSKIPMPKFEWDSKDMEYSLIFFPLVGAVIGALEFAWFHLYMLLEFSALLFCSVAIVLPILVTGGIHLDGFMDTSDALHSYANKEKKLEILKDPHIGAFSVICVMTYLLLAFGFLSIIDKKEVAICLCLQFILARCGSGLFVISLPSAKKEGMLFTFSSVAKKRIVFIALLLEMVLSLCGMFLFSPFYAGTILLSNILTAIYFLYTTKKNFGGITGDLAGYYLSLTELIALMMVGGFSLWN